MGKKIKYISINSKNEVCINIPLFNAYILADNDLVVSADNTCAAHKAFEDFQNEIMKHIDRYIISLQKEIKQLDQPSSSSQANDTINAKKSQLSKLIHYKKLLIQDDNPINTFCENFYESNFKDTNQYPNVFVITFYHKDVIGRFHDPATIFPTFHFETYKHSMVDKSKLKNETQDNSPNEEKITSQSDIRDYLTKKMLADGEEKQDRDTSSKIAKIKIHLKEYLSKRYHLGDFEEEEIEQIDENSIRTIYSDDNSNDCNYSIKDLINAVVGLVFNQLNLVKDVACIKKSPFDTFELKDQKESEINFKVGLFFFVLNTFVCDEYGKTALDIFKLIEQLDNKSDVKWHEFKKGLLQSIKSKDTSTETYLWDWLKKTIKQKKGFKEIIPFFNSLTYLEKIKNNFNCLSTIIFQDLKYDPGMYDSFTQPVTQEIILVSLSNSETNSLRFHNGQVVISLQDILDRIKKVEGKSSLPFCKYIITGIIILLLGAGGGGAISYEFFGHNIGHLFAGAAIGIGVSIVCTLIAYGISQYCKQNDSTDISVLNNERAQFS